MKNKFTYSRFLMFFLSISIPVIFISFALNIMSYMNMVTEIYTNANATSTTGVIQKINYSISFGKSLEKFYGLEDLLKETEGLSDDILNVSVLDNTNKVVSSVGEKSVNFPVGLRNEKYVSGDAGIFFGVPINDEYTMALLLNHQYVNDMTFNYGIDLIKISTLILLGVTLLSYIVYLILKKIKKGDIPFKYFKIILMSALVLLQVSLSGYVILHYNNEYRNSLNKIINIATNVIDNDLDLIGGQGIPFSEVNGVEEYLDNIRQKIEEIKNVSIVDLSQNKEMQTNNYFMAKKIQVADQEYYLNIEYNVNQKIIFNNIFNLAVEAIVLLAVTLLLSIEVSFFFGASKDENKKTSANKVSLRGIRIFYFILFLSLRLDTGFMSVISLRLFEKLNLPQGLDILSGLPSMLTSAATAVGLIFCLVLVNKIGVRKMIVLGAILASIGAVASAIFDNLFTFSIARIIVGLGIAALISSTKLCAIFEKDSSMRLKILPSVAAGQIAGTSCGIVIGGLIASRTSYNFVFILEAVLIVISLLFISITNLQGEGNKNPFSLSNVVGIVKSVRIVMYMLLIIIPIYMAEIFVLYVIPLYGKEIDLTQSVISGLIFLNFLLSAYTSNTGTRLSVKLLGEKKSVIFYIILMIVSIEAFSIGNNIVVALMAVILIGIADGFGLNIIFEYIYRIQPDIDKVTATFMFLLASQVGGAIAPMIVSSNISSGAAKASSILGYMLAGGTMLYGIFLIINKNRQKQLAN